MVTARGAPKWATNWVRNKTVWNHKVETPYHSWWRGVIKRSDDTTADSDGELRDNAEVEFASFSKATTALVTALASVREQLPERARNCDPDTAKNWWPDNDLRATPPPIGTPIVGVIDDGIALSHTQFCAPKKGTRILASWQQSERWGAPSGLRDLPPEVTANLPRFDQKQTSLLAGNELYQHDIDALIAAHSTDGQVDEDTFNRAAGLVNMTDRDGQRTLAFREAHGTHVADIAGGSANVGLMFVNLPSRREVGLSGTYIERLLLLGILRIVTLADKLWCQANHTATNGINGYPIVINMSFSKMAGGRDAITPLGFILKTLNRWREKFSLSKIHFVFPTGNDNLLEGVGRIDLQPGEKRKFELDIPPEDQSSNYLEIWTRSSGSGWVGSQPEPPLKIAVSGPGNTLNSGTLSRGANGQFRDLKKGGQTLARLFSTDVEIDKIIKDTAPPYDPRANHLMASMARNNVVNKTPRIQRYLLAMRPTLSCEPEEAECPSGRWSITLRNASTLTQTVTIAVQSDQSALPAGTTGRRPKLVDDCYKTFAPNGRRIDSYDPETEADTDTEIVPGHPAYVARHGTVNALAAASIHTTRTNDPHDRSVFVAAGYRASDRVPADYSSTGFRHVDAQFPFAPAAAFPTDDSPTLFGILAAGAREGSKVAYRGTSFGAAQATRLISDQLARCGNGFDTKVISDIEQAAACHEPDGKRAVMQPKIGKGRMPKVSPDVRVDRSG
jgi:hypothetical protein